MIVDVVCHQSNDRSEELNKLREQLKDYQNQQQVSEAVFTDKAYNDAEHTCARLTGIESSHFKRN